MLAQGRLQRNTAAVSKGKTAGLIGALLVLLVGCIALVIGLTPAEPSYQGRNASAWLGDFNIRRGKSGGDACPALKAMGPAAAPVIIRRLESSESVWQTKYRLLFPKLPARVANFLPTPRAEFCYLDAGNALFAIGAAVEPGLIKALKSGSPGTRSAAARALGSLKFSGEADIKDAIPGLIQTLGDENAMVRVCSALALGNAGPEAAPAVPSLIVLLKDPDAGSKPGDKVFIRAAAARALGKIGPKAGSASSSLTNLLQDKDDYLRAAAAIAIWRIDADVTNTLPVLTQALEQGRVESKWEVIDTMGEMGPRAKAAVPVLLRELAAPKQSSPSWGYNCGKITNALNEIDREALAKAGLR